MDMKDYDYEKEMKNSTRSFKFGGFEMATNTTHYPDEKRSSYVATSSNPNGDTMRTTAISQRPTEKDNTYTAKMDQVGTINGKPFEHTNQVYVNKDTDTKIQEMRTKFDDYFWFAYEGKKLNEKDAGTYNECSTTNECDKSGLLTQCCVNAVMKYPKTGEWDNMYRCMTTAVADANFEMNLGDFQVNMQCIGNGAAALAASGAVATLAALSLF